MLDVFEERRIAVGEAEIYLRIGGKGPPLLLLHGYPQTHVMWHRVAPRLSKAFTLVMADLRGYGRSKGPKPDPEHRGYSKRAMAEDMVKAMAALGFDRFALAGHDRGGRVGYRLCLDYPERVERFMDQAYHRPGDEYTPEMDLSGAAQDVAVQVALVRWFASLRSYPGRRR